jgi:hypothetical protein
MTIGIILVSCIDFKVVIAIIDASTHFIDLCKDAKFSDPCCYSHLLMLSQNSSFYLDFEE